ncbi:MAG: hypothetical protein KDJ80_05150 [Nitratireductor sp.]|nr:hypothetical protein [Nitratireductor sp.]
MSIAVVLSACQTSDTLSSAADEAARRKVPSGPLSPFKDSLFEYRTPIEIRDGGEFLRVPYDEQRDINGRDELPVRKVKPQYTDPLPAGTERDFTYGSAGRSLGVLGAGKADGSQRFTVIYLHGSDGNRKWGFDDERFGGNFNRLKHLVTRAGGAYLSPDFSDFDEKGIADIRALILSPVTGSAPVVLACGSLGTKLCWQLADGGDIRARLAGIIVLGGFTDSEFLRAAYSGAVAPLPVYIAHGSEDPVFPVDGMEDFYSALSVKGFPARMTVFETGNHGTPVRMIDWRGALNWILSFSRR